MVSFYPNTLVHLGEGNLEITLVFEMETKFNHIQLLSERRVVRLVSWWFQVGQEQVQEQEQALVLVLVLYFVRPS